MKDIRIPVDLRSTDANITFNLDQDFENLEVLSLKLSAFDVYAQMTSDFGVVIGRVSVNGGFGVQNAKISVFIPITTEDSGRAEILQLYPFKGVVDKLPNGIRYNIFPRVKQSNISHQPIGTFPDITDLTYYPTYLEIYEKYYKYTTTTNGAGDFMIFGVPLGAQYLHMDFDLFDTKSFYLTADDLVTEVKTSAAVSAQLSSELTQAINPDFELVTSGSTNGSYAVKPKTDIDAMPNIFSHNKLVTVVPFWGDKTLHEIGLTRCDFEIDYQYAPTAILFGSFINQNYWSDIGDNYQIWNENWNVLSSQQAARDLKVIVYKHKRDYVTERYGIYSAIPSTSGGTDGVFMLSLPMFEDYYVTDEFGQLVSAGVNADGTPNKRGVPTKGHYVFEFFDDSEHTYGNGRRDPGMSLEQSNSINEPWTKMNYLSRLTPGIRVPANREGHYYLGGWATNHFEWNQTLFEYDILKGSPRFYTIETKFNKHSLNNLLLDGNSVTYLPHIDSTSAYNIPINRTDVDGDAILRGSLFAPRFLVRNDFNGIDNQYTLQYANQLTWTPWLPAEQTGNYYVKIWDWIFGIGVMKEKGVNRGEVFNELYGKDIGNGLKSMSDYVETTTWYFGDNPKDGEVTLIPNFYAKLLAEKPESTGRHLNTVHNRFNLAVTDEYTAGLFVSSIDSGPSKILFETSIVDVTEILPDLISKNVYSSYGYVKNGALVTDNKYEDDKYYLFGVFPQWVNSLYELQKRYFNE